MRESVANLTLKDISKLRSRSGDTSETRQFPNSCESGYRRIPVLKCALIFAWIVGFPLTSTAQEQKVILVVGAAGETEYGEQFEVWADNWQSAIESGADSKTKISLARIGSRRDGDQSDADRLKAEIEATTPETNELWIVLMGHGTDDRESSKFNLRGPDVSAVELAQWLNSVTCRVVVINCASASAPFITKLKHDNRIVITATKSAAQHNFARFGGYLSTAINDPANDLDKDQQTSLLEAFLAASYQTQQYYIQETRLATELAMIDDNSDGLGTPADWFEGIRVVRNSNAGIPDGVSANQIFLIRRGTEALLSPELRERRNELETELERLRSLKDSMDEDSYYRSLEPVLLELAKIYG